MTLGHFIHGQDYASEDESCSRIDRPHLYHYSLSILLFRIIIETLATLYPIMPGTNFLFQCQRRTEFGVAEFLIEIFDDHQQYVNTYHIA